MIKGKSNSNAPNFLSFKIAPDRPEISSVSKAKLKEGILNPLSI